MLVNYEDIFKIFIIGILFKGFFIQLKKPSPLCGLGLLVIIAYHLKNN